MSNRKLIREIRDQKYDLIYANTIASSDVLHDLLQEIDAPLILHVHELEMAINLYCDRKKFDLVKNRVNTFIAVSEVVRQNLIANHSIPEEKIALVHEFAVACPTLHSDRETLLRELGIPSNAFVVGGAGTIEWRKGADLFVQVAGRVQSQESYDRPVFFLWIGGHAEEHYLRQIRYDIKTAGLSERVVLPGSKPNPADYFNLFDLFLLPSREDPFPLVSLETGQMGKPIICFDKQVGSTEFIDEHCGAVVPYLGVEAMAEAVLSFYRDPEKLESAGKAIIKKTEPFRIENQGPKILEIIQSVYSGFKHLSNTH
ncbi:MAG: glycosyltransferase [Saprospirales bacterium]|nr:glycosyltransferase [Saprospirales bacterium]